MLKDLLELHDLAGPYFHGFQLNITWPDVQTIYKYKKAVISPRSRIVLQVGSTAFREAGNTPEGLVDKLCPYIDVIDYVLLDRSGGLGKPLNAEDTKPFLQAIKEKLWGVGLGVAGGLSSNTLNLIEPLTDEFPSLSWDAEGLLRDSENELIISETIDYIKGSYSLPYSCYK